MLVFTLSARPVQYLAEFKSENTDFVRALDLLFEFMKNISFRNVHGDSNHRHEADMSSRRTISRKEACTTSKKNTFEV